MKPRGDLGHASRCTVETLSPLPLSLPVLKVSRLDMPPQHRLQSNSQKPPKPCANVDFSPLQVMSGIINSNRKLTNSDA